MARLAHAPGARASRAPWIGGTMLLVRFNLWRATALLALLTFASPARSATLSGRVLEDSNLPLPGVAVSIPELKRGAVTDDSGRYRIEAIPHGVYAVMFSLIGYSPLTRSVHIDEAPLQLDVSLSMQALEGDVITVTGTSQATSLKSSAQATSTVEQRDLERSRGPALMSSLENSPGVTLYSTGQGIVKPVVRGLTSQRVLVLSDGIRQEGQQWGDEHGPELSSMQTGRIEVVRGPGSVLYGSDAIGGVVHVIAPEIPSAETGAPSLRGEVSGDLASNAPGGAGGLRLEGARGRLGYRGSFSGRQSNDVRTPDESLANSSLEEAAGSGAVGWSSLKGSAGVEYSRVHSRLEIHEDPAEDPLATPYQMVEHQRARAFGLLPIGTLRFELDAAWQENRRREFEAEGEGEPALELELRTGTLHGKVHHHPGEAITGTAGISLTTQTNRSLAEEELIPNYDMLDAALYLFETLHLGTATLSAGARFDERQFDVSESASLGVSKQERNYSAFTAQGGVSWQVTEQAALVASVGRAWRAPTPIELFVDGVHEGTVRYELGDSTLQPEASLNLEAGVRVNSAATKVDVSVYRNAIDRYIYLEPTGSVDSASGFDVYQNTQADAVLTGVELSMQWKATAGVQLRGGLDASRGGNDATDGPLPLMPAVRARLGAQVSPARWGRLASPYVAADVKFVAEQDRVDVFESPTAGYVLLDLGAGFELPVSSGRIRIDVQLENALDQAYRDHLSRYKEYALNAGRSLSLKITVPFMLVS